MTVLGPISYNVDGAEIEAGNEEDSERVRRNPSRILPYLPLDYTTYIARLATHRTLNDKEDV